jgi:UDP-glucose:(heptosyl)LPS alpha-1,3-glucosyltransferase
MRIAFAVEHFDVERGGAERYVWELGEWLLAQGHSLDVFAVDSRGTMEGVPVFQLPLNGKKGRSRPFRFAYALRDALRHHTYDIVQGFNHVWPADILMLHGGVHPAFEDYNALSSPTVGGRFFKHLVYRMQPKYRALRANERMQFADAQRHFVAVSERVKQDMLHYYPKSRERIHVVYPGMDAGRFTVGRGKRGRQALRMKLGTGGQTPVLLFVSHNFRLKGLHDLIDALPLVVREMPEAELWVAGRGRDMAYRLQARRRGVENRVRFLGSGHDMAAVYAAADALIHPSYYDSFGGVCLEAMACGLPVAVSRNCGVSELLPREQGTLLFEMPAPAHVIAAAALHALRLRGDETVAQANRAVALRYDRQASFEKMQALYERVASLRAR